MRARELARPVLSRLGNGGVLQRKCACGQHAMGGECADCKKKEGSLQRSARGSQAVEDVPPIVHAVLRSPGQPLDADTRGFMESRFGQSFSQVRIHTDGTAAESAHRIDALAYTSGSQIVFGANRYHPQSPSGLHLLAHELAHVVQQGGNSGVREIAPANGRAEREAASAADAVISGAPAGGIHAQHGGAVQRSLFGDITGGVLGLASGALIGGLLGGPIGALVGGLIGGIAGLVIGDVVSANPRGLTGPEKTEAQLVFRSSLNYDAVQIVEAPIMGSFDNARTPFETIYFPPGAHQDKDYLPWLIHELTHVWQTQRGVSAIKKTLTSLYAFVVGYSYGGTPKLIQAVVDGKHFTDFNTEQQGDILRDYYSLLKAGKDTSAYDPFVDEVRNGGARPNSINTLNPKSAVA